MTASSKPTLKRSKTMFEWRIRLATDYSPYTADIIGLIEKTLRDTGAKVRIAEDFRPLAEPTTEASP